MFNRVLVVKPRAVTQTEGGIHIPEQVATKDRPTKAVVVSVGDLRNPMTGEVTPNNFLKTHDIVIFSQYAGTDHVLEDGTMLCILNLDDIVGVEIDTTPVSQEA